MKVKKYETNEQWLADRPGLITGSKLGDVVTLRGNSKKIGYYQLIADRLAVDDGSVDGMDRGHELEVAAIEALEEATGIKFIKSLEMWVSDENPGMAYSPDGYTEDYTITAEAKCLSSARHIEIVVEGKIPSVYLPQMYQSFIVNEKQQTHYLVSYDPRITAHPVHYIVTHREDIENELNFYRDYQTNVLEEIDTIVENLSF